jgi:LmbE family N-acetylglucosaminyl deacetylase
MKKMIKSFKPTVIFSTSDYDSNPDHKATYHHLKKALEEIKNKIEVYYYLIHYKSRMYPFPRGLKTDENIYPPMSLINLKREWLKLDLSEQETILKNKAIMNYKSQLRMALFLSRKTLLSFIRKNELFYTEKS